MTQSILVGVLALMTFAAALVWAKVQKNKAEQAKAEGVTSALAKDER